MAKLNHNQAITIPDGYKSLSHTEAKKLLRKYGPNEIVYKKQLSIVVNFLLLFKNPLIFILIFAALISGSFGARLDPLLIISIVIMSVTLDFINTYKSQKAAEALKERVKITATVVRDNRLHELPLATIVPGDVVSLSPGDLLPADGKIIQAKDFFVNESVLTGESFPIEKEPGSDSYMGSSVVTGNALMIISSTGRNTKFGKIADMIVKKEEPTDFDRGIKDFSYLIMKITFALVIFVFLVNTLGRHSILESFLFAAALAVGLTPELLPMIIALNLSRGSMIMSKEGVIVKKLSAIQSFGGMDILCTDKTGTLTEDKIVLVKYSDGFGKESEDVFFYAYINSLYQSGFANPLNDAVIKFKEIDRRDYTKIDEIPFDYNRKRNSIVAEGNGHRFLISKGAPEEILNICTDFWKSDKKADASSKKEVHEEYERLSRDGFRVLGVAVKKLTDHKEIYKKDEEERMSFVGFISFLDPPKKTVAETLRKLEEYGIEIKIVTGDNHLVSSKIANEIGLKIKGILTGQEIDKFSDDELRIKAENTTIFSRVSPDQKVRIIELLKKDKHVVGYLGDGINDAPSLKAADVGISVNNAVDVAKESADLILIHKSLHELVNGVIEGRKTFANTLKYLMMTLSSNFGNMFSMAGASLFIPFLPMLPVQILLNNLLYDSSQFVIPYDYVDDEDIKKPKKWDIGFIKKFMIIFGPASSFFDLITFIILLSVFHLMDANFQTGWFLESLATQTLVVHIIRSKKIPFIQSKPSKVLLISTLSAVVIGWLLCVTPVGSIFKFHFLKAGPLLAIVAIVVAYLISVELIKRAFYKKYSFS